MKSKVYLLLLLIFIAFLTYERVLQAFFKPNQELWLEVAEASEESFDSTKVRFLLWNKADPLFEAKGTETTVYAMALNSRNGELIELLSVEVSADSKEKYFEDYKELYDGKEEKLRTIMLLPEVK